MTAELEPISVDGPAGTLAGWATAGSDGPLPVLFLHPVNTAGRIWADVVAALDPPRRCLLPDLRGHGRSTPRGPFTVEGYVADALAVLDASSVERAHVVGGSLGGSVAVALAARVPDRVASVAAFGSPLRLATSSEELEVVAQTIRNLGTAGFFAQIAPATLHPGADQALVKRVVDLATGTGRTPEMVTAILLNALQSDVSAFAPAVRCPCLIANGEHDATCGPAVGRVMAEALSAPHTLLDGLGHLPMVEAPGLVASMLDKHFAGSEP
jgi:pimeloyl-ACP methyl ester carboxylesterase